MVLVRIVTIIRPTIGPARSILARILMVCSGFIPSGIIENYLRARAIGRNPINLECWVMCPDLPL
jgi:hypothetical protein